MFGLARSSAAFLAFSRCLFVVKPGEHASYAGANLLSLLCGCGFARADCPDRLVRNDHLCRIGCRNSRKCLFNLDCDEVHCDARLALLKALAYANNRQKPLLESFLCLFVHGFVGLGKVSSALRVTDDDIIHAEVAEHICGHLAGESALVLEVEVFRADFNICTLSRANRLGKAHERRATYNLAGGVCTLGCNLFYEIISFARELIHFPVAGNYILTHFYLPS